MARYSSAIFVSLILMFSDALAQTTYDVEVSRAVGNGDLVIPMANSGDKISFLSYRDFCYCCEIYTDNPVTDIPRFTTVTTANATVSVTNASLIDPVMPRFGLTGTRRACFRSLTSFDAGVLDFKTYLTMIFGNDGTASANNVRVRCEDTTLFGKYNTSVTDFNFLELRSTAGNSQISVLMSIDNSVNGQAIVDNQEILIGPNQRKDIDIHSLTGAGNFGTVTLCPLAPSKSISAEINQYKIESLNPFSFTPVSKEVFVGRN